jgi:hypothetical protein
LLLVLFIAFYENRAYRFEIQVYGNILIYLIALIFMIYLIISKRLKGTNSQVANEQFGLSEGDFFLFLIENFPIGSKVYFNQLEPEKWIERIQKWGVQMLNRNDFIDYYICAEEFKVVFGKLVEEDPNAVKQIHHFSLVLDGIILIDCLDNFSIVEIEPSFEKLLKKRLNAVQ